MDEKDAKIKELEARVEELEDGSVLDVLEFGVEQLSRGHNKCFIFDSEMIDAAWIATRGSEGGRGILRIFNIQECEGCKGKSIIMDEEHRQRPCPGCDGRGWVVENG